MRNEGISQYRELINSMPVDEQTTVASINAWTAMLTRRLTRTDIDDLATSLGPNCWCEHAGTIEISRRDLFGLAQREKRVSRRLILAVFIWGYPTGGQGNNRQTMLENIRGIEATFADVGRRNRMGQDEVNDLADNLRGCGIGLSTWTKLLYFGQFKVGGHDALILDSKVIKTFERGLFKEFAELDGITYDNGTGRYEKYLRVMSRVAGGLGVANPAKLEMFLFLFSNSLKSCRG